MNVTILDVAIIALPLAILVAARLSIIPEMSRATRALSAARKAVLKGHIRMIQARAERNLVTLKPVRVASQSDRNATLIGA
jgi:hypothetical protein